MKPIYAKSATPPYTEWNQYIANLSDRRIADIVSKLWEQAVEVCKPKVLMAPTAGFYDTVYQIVWDNEEHHLEIDVLLSSGELDWFYRNRMTDELDGGGDELSRDMDEKLIERLKLVAYVK